MGMRWAKEHGLWFLETSALSGGNVYRAFQILLEDIYADTKEKWAENKPDIGLSASNSSVVIGSGPAEEEQCCFGS